MSFHLVKRLMFVLAAFAILGAAMVSPGRAVAASAGMEMATNCDDCPAIKFNLPCSSTKPGHCTLACYDAQPGAMVLPAFTATSFAFTPISYHDAPAALRGHSAEPALFPPKHA